MVILFPSQELSMLARISSFSLFFALLASIAIALTGCGSGGPTLLPVTGSVTVDGKPANGATLIFHPTD
jgi:predicted small lipoprotein YifL